MHKKKKNGIIESSRAARLAAAIICYPRDFVGIVTVTCVSSAIIVNALFLQPRPHPGPIFASAPLFPESSQRPGRSNLAELDPKSNEHIQGRSQLVSDIQRELNRRGFYDGDVDGTWGSKTDIAARDFVHTSGVKVSPIASENLLRAIVGSDAKSVRVTSRMTDPIAALIEPPRRVAMVQRALADLGYGQLKITGIYNSETQAAIEKFENDRHIPVTGRISDRLLRELVAMAGHQLE